MKLQQFCHHDQTITYTKQPVFVLPRITEDMLSLIEKWQQVFPRENTFVQREYGVPSLMVRFDCVVNTQDKLQVYEVQEGCGGAGYAGAINDVFRKTRNHFKKEVWPRFKLLTPKSRVDHDDDMWLKRITLKKALQGDHLLQIRHPLRTLDEEQRSLLVARSVMPWAFHSDKRYGVELGLWRPVFWTESNSGLLLPWNEGFTLKPMRSYGSRDVMSWNPQEKKGRATRAQICAALEKHGTMYLQPFIPPTPLSINETTYHMVLRPFFGFDVEHKQWKPMHGIWVARPYPNLRIHGAPDTIMGPLYSQT